MSEPIKAGDLVAVVRDCCGKYLGEHFHAAPLPSGYTGDAYCEACKATVSGPYWGLQGYKGGRPASWLKRIPPLDELEGEKHDEEITA